MWHEARKQEKKIRGMLVDYRKRAERRQDFYERIKADPTQFLQVHGRKCKIHLDASVATAAENPAIMMPWQGQKDNLIDRFDVRAHLDYIPPVPRTNPPDQPDAPDVDDADERAMNYERYRVLAQNEFLGIVEEKYLHQLYLEEQFGVNAQIEAETKAAAAAAKKKSSAGAAIGYTYEETETLPGGSGPGGVGTASIPFSQSLTAIEKASEASATPLSGTGTGGPAAAAAAARFDECMKDDSDSDLDMDVSIDINKIGTNQAHELNTCGRQYGMKSNDFYSFLTKDADEADALRMAREEEQEKIMFSGRKSRRERRAQRERKVAGRPLSPPSYAAKEELVPRTFVEANDSSRSPSPVNSGKITYITSFGGEEELQPHGKISFGFARDMSTLGGIAGTSKAAAGLRAGASGPEGSTSTLSYADKVKQNLEKLKTQAQSKESDRKPPVQYQRAAAAAAASGGRGRGSRSSSGSRSSRSSRGRSRGRRRRSSSSSRSRSRERSRSKSRRRLRGTAVGRSRSRSRSRSGGRSGAGGRSTYSRYRRRSKTKSRSRSRSHSRTRAKASRRSPRRRYPAGGGQSSSTRRRTARSSSSSSSSSSSTSSRSRSRSRTPPVHRAQPSRTKLRTGESQDSDGSRAATAAAAKQPAVPAIGTQEKLPLVVPHTLLGVLPPPPPPPPPVAVEAAVDEKKPLPTLALIEPEPEVPIKRYYGRRRGDESSSDDASTSGDDTNGDGDRKPTVVLPPALPTPELATGADDSQSGAGTIKPACEMVLQIKQEKLENPAIEQQPVVGPTVGVGGSGSASLRFGKTVTGGTSAPESKVSKNNSNRKPKPKQPQPLYPIVSEYHHHHDHQQKKCKTAFCVLSVSNPPMRVCVCVLLIGDII
uniref:Suppressor of white apricot N-terminal domain-containing protein n=1 Tax=Anopheles gambiae TaxID=7165 RepID=A0A1S4GG34_ANOGA